MRTMSVQERLNGFQIVSRQTAKNLIVNRWKRAILTVNRQRKQLSLAVKQFQGLFTI